MQIKHKTVYGLLALLTLLALLIGIYLQYFDNQAPCLLCLLQRFFTILLLLVLGAAIYWVKNGRTKNIFNCFLLVIAGLGLLTASRQVWLQLQPASSDLTCLPNLFFLLKNFPWHEVLKMAFLGSSDCRIVSWRLKGFSLAELSLLYFSVVILVILFQFRKIRL
ncbi:MAG: hypothetical protein A3E87_10070 [Gammaproteobacteria bacterium RIFCSPHIGHO2_12_FULL_35_23]|nr:MAG: hypothetical protein A3E87_10070 [Gammaproteobacteria bacterium RIFCSPHIGHO2_12_FULL_35_23]